MEKKKRITAKIDILDEVMNSKPMKVAKIAVLVVGGIYAFGIGCRVLSYTVRNYKILKSAVNSQY
jgi:hypothetical protein